MSPVLSVCPVDRGQRPLQAIYLKKWPDVVWGWEWAGVTRRLCSVFRATQVICAGVSGFTSVRAITVATWLIPALISGVMWPLLYWWVCFFFGLLFIKRVWCVSVARLASTRHAFSITKMRYLVLFLSHLRRGSKRADLIWPVYIRDNSHQGYFSR